MSVRDFVPHWDIALLFAAFWLSNDEGGPFVTEGSRGHFGAHRRDARRHVWTRGTAGVRDDECGPVRGTVAIVATIALMVALAFQVV